MKTKQTSWYSANTGNHQGLVIEEATGRNVAVAYDKKDAAILASAPDLLTALIECEKRMEELQKHTNYPLAWPRVMARAAIEKATK